MRATSKQEEDEESLTLTNTSEESGIQMQHGSEDLSFCDDEPIRSCLAHSSSLKVRHVKFKVRFKDEIETFEDSSSRLSSGIESEDQSDGEMETKFPYTPPRLEKSVNREKFPMKPLRLSEGGICSGALPQGRSDEVCDSCNAGVLPLKHAVPYHSSGAHNYHILGTSRSQGADRFQVEDQTENVAPPTKAYLPSDHQQNHHSTTPRLVTFYTPADNPCMSVQQNRYDNDRSPHLGQLQRSTPHNIPFDLCHLQANNKHLRCPSKDRSSTKTNEDAQTKNALSNLNPQKKETRPPAPPVRDSKTKLRSSNLNLLENNSTPDTSSKTDSFPKFQYTQNGHRKFWFADTSLNLARNGITLPTDNEDTTLKFTLKFDTCPTSGLSSRQEQIGFYV